MSLSSESGFIDYSDIKINGIRMDDPRNNMEKCIDLLVIFKEQSELREPGVHISIPLDIAKELADAIYKEITQV